MNLFDKNIKESLNSHEYEFQSDYWNSMEQKLNEATSSKNGSVQKVNGGSELGSWTNLFIYTSIISVALTSIYFVIDFTKDTNPNSSSVTVSNRDQWDTDKTYAFNAPVEVEKIIAPVIEEVKETPLRSYRITNRKSKQLTSNQEKQALAVDLILSTPSVSNIVQEEILVSDTPNVVIIKKNTTKSDNDFEIPNPQYNTTDNRDDTSQIVDMNVISKLEKDKKPMQKPNKRVFKRRKGILYLLGFRR